MEKFEKLTSEKALSLKNKYIFHGSPKKFDICFPNQAVCESGNPENLENAIYGSSEIDFAVLFAFNKIPIGKNSGWRANTKDGKSKATLFNLKIDLDAKGYLYCFKKENFVATKDGGIQFISKTPQNPEIVLELEFKDFSQLFEVSNKNFDERNQN